MALLCLELTGKKIRENIQQVEKYRSSVDLVELRADCLAGEELFQIHKFPLMVSLPVILSIRREETGGSFNASEEERRKLFELGLTGNYAFVDFEAGFQVPSLKEKALNSGIKIIRSFHNLSGVERSALLSSEIPKFEVRSSSTADFLRFIEAVLSLKEEPSCSGRRIFVARGDYGFPSVVLAEKLGSFITYCSAEGRESAHGHSDPETLQEIYRFKNIKRETSLFGIIGNPVMHTRSPRIHNPAFKHLGIDAVYIPFQTDTLPEFMKLMDIMDIRGFSVTIPHKERIIEFLDSQSEAVSATGSCNTVVRRGKKLHGENYDVEGFLDPLKKRLGSERLKGMKATVIGAGGAARSVVFALVSSGVEVCIINRTKEKAEKLAKEFRCKYEGLDESGLDLARIYNNLVVQTTSVGMYPNVDGDPLPEYEFKRDQIVYDLIYIPEETNFLKRAKEAGCTVIGGGEMLLQQAYRQFSLFTGKQYPFNGSRD